MRKLMLAALASVAVLAQAVPARADCLTLFGGGSVPAARFGGYAYAGGFTANAVPPCAGCPDAGAQALAAYLAALQAAATPAPVPYYLAPAGFFPHAVGGFTHFGATYHVAPAGFGFRGGFAPREVGPRQAPIDIKLGPARFTLGRPR